MVRRASFKTGLIVLLHHGTQRGRTARPISLVCNSEREAAPAKHHSAITMSQIAHPADEFGTGFRTRNGTRNGNATAVMLTSTGQRLFAASSYGQ
jgi:hypothetical protein